MLRQSVVILFLWQALLLTGVAANEVPAKKWILYHALGGSSDWVRRGTVELSVNDDAADEKVQLQVENDESCLSDAAAEALLQDKWYRLKLVEDGNDSAAVMTTVSSCQVRRSGFRDEMILNFGQRGSVVSFSYIPLVSPLAPKSCTDLPPLASGEDGETPKLQFKSRISYESAVPGMTLRTVLPSYQPPPGLLFISNKNTVAGAATTEKAKGKPGTFGNTNEEGSKEGAAGGQEEQFDATPFGFLRRYWYIIVPMMLMNIMGGAPEEGKGGEQQGGEQAAAVAAPAAAAPKGGGGGGKRRGKRS